MNTKPLRASVSRHAHFNAAHPEIGPVVSIAAHDDPDAVTVRCIEALVQRWPDRFAAAAHAALQSRA